MLIGMLPTSVSAGAPAAQVTGLNNYVVEFSSDPSTAARPSTFGTASDDGRVWADKSISVNGTQFDVTLSALAQEYVRTSSTEVRAQAAADVAMVLDMSGSMTAERVTKMKDAVNKGIETIMAANPRNRIGIYYFGLATGSNVGTLFPLASYSTSATGDQSDAADRYLTSSGQKITRKAGLTQTILGGATTTTTALEVSTSQGTATQTGLYTAINALKADVAGRINSSEDTERVPYVLLFTDGDANRAYPNWYNSPPNGTETSTSTTSGNATISALTILTAAKLKDELKQAYSVLSGGKDVIWFNIAFGLDEGDNLATAMLKPNTLASAATSQTTLKSVYTALTTLTNNAGTDYKKYGVGGTPGYVYADDYIYFVSASNLSKVDDAMGALGALVEAATQEKIIPFEQTSASGEPLNLVVTDVLGNEMELKTVPQMGTATATVKSSLGSVTTYGFTDLDTTVEYDSATRELKWIIPPKELPLITFSDRKAPTPGQYSNPDLLPVQLTYTVGLRDAYASDTSLYSSKYEGDGVATATTRFIPVEDNPYYYKDITKEGSEVVSNRKEIGADIEASVSKISNITDTASDSDAYEWDVTGTDSAFITKLGNNGKITPKLKIEMTPASSSVAAGENVAYQITITNLSSSTISNVIVNDALPSGLTLVSGSMTEGSDSKPTATFPYTISSVPANGSVELTFKAEVESNETVGTEYINNATITSVAGTVLNTPASVSSDKVTVADTFSPSVTLKLDGVDYAGQSVELWKDGESKYSLTASGAIHSASGVTPGTYDIYVNGESTGAQLSGSDASKVIHYYSVSFYDGAQKYDTPAAQTILSGGAAVLPTAPTKVGYTFDQWVTTNGGTTAFDFTTAITSTTNIYAKWTTSANTAYTVNHYQEAVDGTYSAAPTVETLTGTTGDTTSAVAQTFTGFTAEAITQGTIAADGSTVVNVYYKRNLYDITYVIDPSKGTTTDETTPKVRYEAAPTEPNIIDQPGYTFTGWDKTIEPATDNETYTAQFDLTDFTITYNLNGGSVEDANPDTYTVESADITLNNPTRPGYIFDGWTGTGLTEPTTTVTITQGSTDVRNYAANWSPSNTTAYTVNHYQEAVDGSTPAAPALVETLNGTTGDTTSAVAQTVNGFTAETITQGTIAGDGSTVVNVYYKRNLYDISFVIDPTKGTTTDETAPMVRYEAIPTEPVIIDEPGYAFTGWNKTIEPATGNETYTAQFDLTDFSITYNLDGGSVVNANPDTYTVESVDITLNNPTRPGYTFDGWTGTDLTDEPTTTVTIAQGSTGDRNYAANWIANTGIAYTVNHYQEAVDGSTPADPALVETLNGTTGDTTSAVAQTFTGFTAEAITQETIAADGSTVVNVYYKRNLYDISFVIDPIKGTAIGDTMPKVRYEATPTAPFITTVPGYTFTDWDKTLEPATSNETYTAQFDLTDFSITYDLDHGTVNPSNPGTFTIEDEGFTLTNPTRPGYTFAGWTGTGLSEPTFTVAVSKGSTDDRIYTATWIANSSIVMLDDNGGSGGSGSVTAIYDQPMPTAEAPSQAGYTFVGYFDQPSDGTKYYDADMNSVKDWDKTDLSVTLYAVWTEIGKVTIEYAANQTTGGTVSSTYESLNPETGTAVGSAATANPGYRFVEWQDANGDTVSTSAVFVPQKDSDSYAAATYTAVFEAEVYTITYNLDGGTTASSNPTTFTVADDAFTLTNPTKLGYTFAGWTGTGLSEPTLTVTVDKGSTGDRVYNATWQVVSATGNYIVIGTVIDDETPSNNLSGATVELVKGNTQYGETALTDADGKFTIHDVPAGVYDLKITLEEKTAIIAVTIGGATQVVDLGTLVFPYNASSALKLKGSDTPPIVIDNLQPEAVDYLLNDYNNTGFAKVEMTVEKIDESSNDTDQLAAMSKIKSSAQNNNLTIGLYLDMLIEKFYRVTEVVNWNSEGLITRTNGLIKVIVPIPAEVQGKSGYTVYRYHGSAVNVISAVPNADGEYLTLDQSDWTLTLYVKNFSVYAIAYNSPQVQTPSTPSVIVGTTNYAITFNGDGGTPSSTTQSAAAGDLLTKPADPVRTGYIFAGWYKADGSEWNFSTDTVYSDLTLTAKWTVADTNTNTNIPALDKVNHFAYMQGYPDKTFGSQKNMTRAEVTVMFARLLVEKMDVDKTYASQFTDVNPARWYANAIGYMEQFGIITGYADGTFRPDAQITRAEFAAIASRFDELITGEPVTFTDVADNDWARDYISFAASKGWIKGYPDGTFRPGNNITRAEVVSLVNRMLERYADTSYVDNNQDLLNQYVDLTSTHWAYYDIMEATNSHDYDKTSDSETWKSNTK
ncbi:InlB B-repeat-containing protein (plasmid) [Paenibacillus cellulosilyticus]|nr:InlB B-repeat-containing protein [Paenibacillus cellulosilyticus]